MATRHTTLACAAVALSFALAGCGSGAATSSVSSFRSAFVAARARVNSLLLELDSTLTGAGPRPGALQASAFTTLGSRIATEASAVDGLNPPVSDNTRVRDLGSSLEMVANGLDDLSTAATQHNDAGSRAALAMLHADAAGVQQAEATVARALRLASR